jgi:hypothetical protein
MNETVRNRWRVLRDKRASVPAMPTVNAATLEATPTTDAVSYRATTSRPGRPFASLVPAPMRRSEPATQNTVPEVKLRWLATVLVIGAIALLGWMVMIIEIRVRTLH